MKITTKEQFHQLLYELGQAHVKPDNVHYVFILEPDLYREIERAIVATGPYSQVSGGEWSGKAYQEMYRSLAFPGQNVQLAYVEHMTLTFSGVEIECFQQHLDSEVRELKPGEPLPVEPGLDLGEITDHYNWMNRFQNVQPVVEVKSRQDREFDQKLKELSDRNLRLSVQLENVRQEIADIKKQLKP